ncbi:MAG: lamin tail domain-containing protein [Roseibacillus sp.]
MDPDSLSSGPTCFNLEREVAPGDWEMIATATGPNANTLSPAQFTEAQLQPYAGETVRFAIYDLSTGGWGHIDVDNIVLSASVDITDPTDSDGDGIGDNWEEFYFGNLDRDGTLDFDGDTLTDLQEWTLQTNPTETDSDGDHLTDGQELTIGTDPNDSDSDDDGWSDGDELVAGTDPNDSGSAPTPPPAMNACMSSPATTRDAVIVFNEIHYQPAGDDSTLEFVELYNQLSVDVDMSNWLLEGDIRFDFPEGTVLGGGEYLVVAKDPAALQAATSFGDALGPFTGSLANSGKRLLLYNNNRSFRTLPGGAGSPGEVASSLEARRIMDEIDYRDVYPWPAGPDGSGSTLAKRSPSTGSPHPGNWAASVQPNGTPGIVNLFPLTPALVLNELAASIDPNFRLELYNRGTSPVLLGGMVLASSNPAHPDYVLPAGVLNSGEFLTIDAATLGYTPEDNNRLFLFSAGGNALVDAARVDDRARARSPDGIGRWLRPKVATLGAPNSFALRDEVVINEIFYHAYPQRASAGTPSGLADVQVLDFDSNWRFNLTAGPAGLPADWATVAHAVDLTNWDEGPGLLGEESATLGEPIRTPIALSAKIPYYFETEFTCNDPATVTEMIIDHYVDDGAVFYLNGVEIDRFNMLAGPFIPATTANPGVSNAALNSLTISAPNILPGSNRLSIEIHQSSPGSSDVIWGARVTLRKSDGTGTPATPYFEREEEWLELYNRGPDPVDLTGWKLDGGIGYSFPDATTIPSGGYLVVAKDAATLAVKHPAASIVGDYSKRLGNGGDLVVLEDNVGNPVDEVVYYDFGNWHAAADGGGSSLELRDPDADNKSAGAWSPSDESSRSSWNTYTYEGVAVSDGIGNNVYHEFLLGVLDAGELLLDDVSVIENGSLEFIQNGDFEGDPIGDAADKWRALGTHGSHGRTVVVTDPDDPGNKCLHLVATGPTEDKHNKVESTFANGERVVTGRTYRISFRAKWLSGSNQVNTRLYFNYLQRTTIIEVPEIWGTPGFANSTAVGNSGPTISDLAHSPVVPDGNQAVTVTVQASDPEGIGAMAIYYSVNGGGFQSTTMATSGDGRYSGTIPGQSAGRIVRFYVRGSDNFNAMSFQPAAGPEGGAFYKVQDGLADGSGLRHNFRIVMAESDRAFLFLNTNRMSNDRFPVTVIEDEQTAYYDVGLRFKASAFGRFQGSHYGFNIRFQPDCLFRGVHDTISVERSPNLKEILAKHLMNRAGGGYWSFYDDVSHIITPNTGDRGPGLLSMARHTSTFFDGLFPDASKPGTLYNLELLYNPNGTTGGPEGLKIGNPYNHTNGRYDLKDRGLDQEPYRWGFQIRSTRSRDDYAQLVALNRAMELSGTALKNALDPIIDVDQWMRTFAMASLNGTDDVYARIWEHNFRYYVRPTDNKVLIFQWDLDRSFQLSTSASVTPSKNSVLKLFSIPEYRRLFDGHLNDLIQTTFNSTYTTPWAAHFSTLTGDGLTGLPGYLSSRASFIQGRLPNAMTFQITTNGGNDFSDADSVVDLTGTGWIDVFTIEVDGVPAPVTWTTTSVWRITVPINIGPNPLTLTAYDYHGTQAGTDSITVTNTSAIDLANAGNTIISELHYHPATPTQAESAAGFIDQEFFEFIELTNTSAIQIDYSSVRFTDGIIFEFPIGTILAPGARLLVVSNQAAFQFRYGAGFVVAGEFSGNLRNSGEHVRLEAADTTPIADFTYGDDLPWPESADGPGYSLVLAGSDPTDPFAWRSSTVLGGNPGSSDSIPFSGTVDEMLSHASSGGPFGGVVGDAFVVSFDQNLAADDLEIRVEFSTDLITFTPATSAQLVSRFNNGDGTATIAYQSLLPWSAAPRQFARISVRSP